MRWFQKILLAVGTLLLAWWSFTLIVDRPVVAAMLITSVALHELAHAMAFLYSGYTSWMFFIPFLGAAVVPENGEHFTKKARWWNHSIVCLAGPLTNAFLALVGILISRTTGNQDAIAFASINAGLAIFNLLPVPIFDGGKFVKRLFDSADEKTDRALVIVIGTAVIATWGTLLLMGKIHWFYPALILWRFHRESEKDNPNAWRSKRAMTHKQVWQMASLYAAVMILTWIAELYLPATSRVYA